MFREMTRPLLWRYPKFKQPLQLKHLSELAALHVSIRHLESIQINCCHDDAQEHFDRTIFFEAISLISDKFQLDSFVIDTITSKYDLDLTPKDFDHIMQCLPVCRFNMAAFRDDLSASMLVPCLVAMQQSCPQIIIEEDMHERLSLDDWQHLVKAGCPVVKIRASFTFIPIDFARYNNILKGIQPSCHYTLACSYAEISPEELSCLTDIRSVG